MIRNLFVATVAIGAVSGLSADFVTGFDQGLSLAGNDALFSDYNCPLPE